MTLAHNKKWSEFINKKRYPVLYILYLRYLFLDTTYCEEIYVRSISKKMSSLRKGRKLNIIYFNYVCVMYGSCSNWNIAFFVWFTSPL